MVAHRGGRKRFRRSVGDDRTMASYSIHRPENWPAVLTSGEAAAILGLNRQTIQSMIARGELPAVKAGKLWRIAPEDIWQFVPPGIRSRWPAGPWHEDTPT